MGTQNGHNVPFLESASLRKRKRNTIKRIKQIYKISKKGNKKISFIGNGDCLFEEFYLEILARYFV